MDVRYDVADLDTPQRRNFVNALVDLKRMPSKENPPPGTPFPKPTNRYDDFVMMHMLSFSEENPVAMVAHQSPTFLPWHRAYLRMLERELQSIKPEYRDVTIPYWDWTNAESNKAVWDVELLGGEGRESDARVMDGKFAFDSGNWKLYVAPSVSPAYTREDLCRRFNHVIVNGVQRPQTLPTSKHVNDALDTDPYDTPEWNIASQPSFRNILEGGYGEGQIHNIVHMWVGGLVINRNQLVYAGAMSFGGSPNDPCFWLHHSNIDRLWADWQLDKDHWNLDYKGYRPVNEGPDGFNVNDPMLPWLGNITPARVSDFYHIDSRGYKYDKYFRSHIKDKDTVGAEDVHVSASMEQALGNTNLGLFKGSTDVLLENLRRPIILIE